MMALVAGGTGYVGCVLVILSNVTLGCSYVDTVGEIMS